MAYETDVIANPQGSEATETETPASSSGTGSVAPDASQGATNDAGGSQETAEDGSVNGQESRSRRNSPFDTIKELRAKRREDRAYWETKMGEMSSRMEELQKAISLGNQSQRPSKSFFEAPEEVLDERLNSRFSELEKNILKHFDSRHQQDSQDALRQQETNEAVKLAYAQKGFTTQDESDLAEIIQEKGLGRLGSIGAVEAGLLIWKERRGISDKSALKAKASTVMGAPPTNNGARTWTEAEMSAELDKFPKDPKNWTPEQNKAFETLERELKSAHIENRVK